MAITQGFPKGSASSCTKQSPVLDDAKLFMHDFGQRSEAVSCAGGIGNLTGLHH